MAGEMSERVILGKSSEARLSSSWTRQFNVSFWPILLKNSFSRAAGPTREKSTSQIALQAAREHRLGV